MNIIWDFDGTIYNTYPRILNAFDVVLNSKYELDISLERIEDLVFIDTKYCAKVVAEENSLDYELLLDKIRSYYDQNGETENVFPEVIPILKDGISYNHFLVTHRDRRSLEKKLIEAGIFDCFREIISKDDGFEDKPAPDSFEYLIKKYNLNKTETAAIGDRDIDVGAGRNAGVKTILISKRLESDADITIGDHSELSKTVQKVGG